MLKIKDLHVNYGAIKALKGINLTVKEKSIVTLIGANGAGKTTLLRTISSILKPVSGSIEFNGRNTVSLAPVSYTHLRAHETVLDLVCRLLLEKKKTKQTKEKQ